MSTCVTSGLEMFYSSWIVLICLWCWGCYEGLLGLFQGSSILTTFLSPEEKSPSRGEDTAQTNREGAAEAVFAACPIHRIIVLVIIPQRVQVRGSGGAWEGWIMSLEMEKLSHFMCQAPKLVGLRMFSSHPWGDLCPLKNPLGSLGLLCCSFRWPLLVPICGSYPQREIISSCFSFWATKGGFILCTLMSSHSLPTFCWELSVPSCSQMRKGKKPLWSGEAEPGEFSRREKFQEGLNKGPQARGQSLSTPTAVPLLDVDSKMQNVNLGKTHLWMSPRAAASTGLVQFGCKVFCAILHLGLFCNDTSKSWERMIFSGKVIGETKLQNGMMEYWGNSL